ncbi:hypothetical protein JF55_13685 [Pseudomonas sp. 1-7]|nr:hypothetical protein JF55_13685 [Pseudomonas sp. 1-7]
MWGRRARPPRRQPGPRPASMSMAESKASPSIGPCSRMAWPVWGLVRGQRLVVPLQRHIGVVADPALELREVLPAERAF